jgi:hypothetical protein
MCHNYLSYITDQHLINCISNLYQSYQKAKANIGKQQFYSNKIDVFKLTFDTNFNNCSEENLIENEIMRQIDKSINNSIGTFHEQILGGIEGYEIGNLSGFDIKAVDNSLFADIKNKHNTMNSSSAESLFQKLAKYADSYKKANCYWVQILAKNSFCEKWQGEINGKEYSHSRVFKISGDQFYAMLSGDNDALLQLYKILPIAINDFLKTLDLQNSAIHNSALSEIQNSASTSNRNILDQITFDNFSYYSGFGDL